MTVPSGVIRGLATVAFNLEEGSEEDEAHDVSQPRSELLLSSRCNAENRLLIIAIVHMA